MVDDEPALRRLTAMALSKHGISCDHAENGQDALEHLQSTRYDAVVTDLAMPVMNGHALAVQILSRPDRPLLIVVTGVLEPKLAKDLMARGVDDIVFKPIDFQGFALKLKVILDRRGAILKAKELQQAPPSKGLKPYDLKGLKAITSEELERQLAGVASLVPISSAALDVYQLVTTVESSISTLTAAVERDGALIAEMLRLANSSQLNPSARRIVKVEDAILRLGTTRVAELAMAVSAMTSMTQEKIPWMDLDLEWRRSISSGVALELLLDRAPLELKTDGLLLSVILHAMGRYVLAILFPRHYEVLLAECARRKSSLEEAERQVFPLDHAAVLSRLLEQWKIAPEVYRPLAHVSEDLAALTNLTHDLRAQVELIKTSILLGRAAQGRWHAWDAIDLPTEALLAKWRIDNVESVIAQIRQETSDIAAFRRSPALSSPATAAKVETASLGRHSLPYYSSSPTGCDVLPFILASAGYVLEPVSEDQLAGRTSVLINGLERIPDVDLKTLHGIGHQVLAPARDARKHGDQSPNQVTLPCSFAALDNACLQVVPRAPDLGLDVTTSPGVNAFA